MTWPAAALGALARVASIDTSRGDAQRAARAELSRRQYAATQPPLLYRALGRAVRWLIDLISRASGHVPGGGAGMLILLAVLVLAAAVVLTRLGRLRRQVAAGEVFGDEGPLSAEQHRELAERAAAQGNYADAVRERLRGVVRELEARGVLDPRPGRTAGEVAVDAGAALPRLAGSLRRGTATFDQVWYGGQRADAASYAILVELDRQVRESRLAAV